MNKVKSLLVLWKNKRTNVYYHIGTLGFDGNKYTFQYTYHSDAHRKVKEALRNGYRLHPTFPKLEKEYISTSLFAAFERRIPSIDRVDYDKILDDLGLPFEADRMDILRETRGMLSGDAYSFEEPLRLYDDHLETNFYINGMRHQGLPKKWPSLLQIGDRLHAIPEDDNEHDPYAVRIVTSGGLQLGYIPGVYAQAVKALLRRGTPLTLTVKDIRSTLAPQWWVYVGLSGELNSNEPSLYNDKELDGLLFRAA
ncbi:HIRAN domain-containing protein [Virgibacillus ainsalahensis]